MASNSRKENGSTDTPPEEPPTADVVQDCIKAIEMLTVDLDILELQIDIDDHNEIMTRAEEVCRDPRNEGITDEDLQLNQDYVQSKLAELEEMKSEHETLTEMLSQAQNAVKEIGNKLNGREAELRFDESRYQHEMEDRQIQLNMSLTNKGKDFYGIKRSIHLGFIESARLKLLDCRARIRLVEPALSNYIKEKKRFETIKKHYAPTLARLRTVKSMVESKLAAIENKLKIPEKQRTVMSEQAGPSGLQRTANVEGGSRRQMEEKSETDDSEEEEMEVKRFSKRRRGPEDDYM